MHSQCGRINRRLMRRGYEVLSEYDLTVERAGGDGDITAVNINFKLYLATCPSLQNQTGIRVANAVSRMCNIRESRDDSLEAVFLRTETYERNINEVASFIWHRNWEFAEEENHVLLAAAERHWEKFMREPASLERVIPGREDFLQTVKCTRFLAPAGIDDIHTFSFFLDRELEYLAGLSPDTELHECGCEAQDHLQALEDWEMRNLL